MELHPAVAHLAPLLGTWRGGGRGDYPTIEAFTYTEEVTIGHVGKPFLAYSQRTKGADGSPLHAECGYWRPDGEQGLEMLVVHPSGIGEILVGEVTETHYGLLVVLRAGAGAGGPETGAGDEGPESKTGSGSRGPETGSGSRGPETEAGSRGPETGAGGSAIRAGSGGQVVLAPTAKRVDATERRISIDHAVMRYEVHMAAVGEPMTHHLEATLHRAD